MAHMIAFEFSVTALNLLYSWYLLNENEISTTDRDYTDNEANILEVLSINKDRQTTSQLLIAIGFGMFMFSIIRAIKSAIGFYLIDHSPHYI